MAPPHAFQADFVFNRDAFSGLHPETMPSVFDEERYTAPRPFKDVPDEVATGNYPYAKDLAASVVLRTGLEMYQVVSGRFIFGDFIDALLRQHHICAKELTISTYSFSKENIDCLRELLLSGHVQKLNIIISAAQHSHELHMLVKYALDELDIENRFQYAAAGSHCKLALIETIRGNKLTLDGSANLRSSGCLEQFNLREGAGLYDFNYAYQKRVLERYGVVNHEVPLKATKPLRHAKLWEEVVGQSKPSTY